MLLAGLQKLTLLDYPGKTAATLFTPGCDFRCPFCHNLELVRGEDASETRPVYPSVPIEDVFSFLSKRHGLLDGICITGGEPLMQDGLEEFCARVHDEGFLIKMDTNGSYPERLRHLVESGLVDKVAMDVKNAPERYGETVGVPGIDLADIQESIDFLMSDIVPYEFRTTVVREYHSDDDLKGLARWIAGASAWFLQGFIDSDTVLAGKKHLHARPRAELEALLPRLREFVSATELRGI